MHLLQKTLPFIVSGLLMSVSAHASLKADTTDHISITSASELLYANQIGYPITIKNPGSDSLTLQTISIHIPLEYQQKITGVLPLNGIAAQPPVYDKKAQAFRYTLSGDGLSIDAGASITTTWYVLTDAGDPGDIARAPVSFYANEGQLTINTNLPGGVSIPLQAKIQSLQGDVEQNIHFKANSDQIVYLPGSGKGVHYTVSFLPAAVENSNSITEYLPQSGESQTSVLTGKNTALNMSFEQHQYNQDNLVTVKIVIDGLSENNVKGTLTATADNGLVFSKSASFSDTPETGLLIPNDQQHYKIAASIPGYTLSQTSCQRQDLTETCHYSAKPTHQLIGYWADWGPWSIAQTAEHHYSTLIIAFGNIANNSVSLQAFGPNGNEENMIRDIAAARKVNPDLSVLISFGGANNTYDITDDLSDAGVDALAVKLDDFLTLYGLDGVDFDIESTRSFHVLHRLIHQIQALRQQRDQTPYIITAAPQFNTDASGQGLIVSTWYETEPYYQKDDFSGLSDFNYIMLQEYNTPLSTPFYYNGQSYYENDFGLFSGSFETLKKLIPQSAATKLVIGEPASFHRAAQPSVHFSYTNGKYSPRTLNKVTSSLLGQINKVIDDPQFGGVMTWDTYDDQIYNQIGFNDPYGFSNVLGPCLINNQCSIAPATPKIIWDSQGLPAMASLTGGQFSADASLTNAPDGDQLIYECEDQTTKKAICSVESQGHFSLSQASENDQIVISAKDSLGKAETVASRAIIVNDQPQSLIDVYLENDMVPGYLYRIDADGEFIAGGWGQVSLGKINLNQTPVSLKAWNDARSDKSIPCPLPESTTITSLTYAISGSLDHVSCTIQN
ncbi:MAG: glycoside hydrolase family 18 protein [Francisellaceae bacterium]